MNSKHLKELSIEHARTRGAVQIYGSLLARGFFGRLKWLLFGK